MVGLVDAAIARKAALGPQEECTPEDNKFHWACTNVHPGEVEYWYNKGAEVTTEVAGSQPIHRCAVSHQDSAEVMGFLLERDADPNAVCTADGTRPLHLAMLQGNLQTATRLIEGGALINAGDKEGRTAMAYERRAVTDFDKVVEPRKSRVLKGKEDILQMLREAGGVMQEPEEGPAFLAEYVPPADAEAEAETAAEPAAEPETAAEPAAEPETAAEPEKADVSTPPVTPQAAEKVAATPGTPLDRLSILEEAIGLPSSTAGMMDRLESLEAAVHKADHVLDTGLPGRIDALERAIGM